MKFRAVIALLAACVTLSTGTGFAAAKLSEPEPAKAGSSKAVLQIVRDINAQIGSTSKQDSIAARVFQICLNTTNNAVGEC